MSVGSLLGNLSCSCVARVGLDMGSEVLTTAFNIQAFTMLTGGSELILSSEGFKSCTVTTAKVAPKLINQQGGVFMGILINPCLFWSQVH